MRCIHNYVSLFKGILANEKGLHETHVEIIFELVQSLRALLFEIAADFLLVFVIHFVQIVRIRLEEDADCGYSDNP